MEEALNKRVMEAKKRRERLKAMRMEADQSGAGNDFGNSTQPRGLPSPLLETAATNQDSCPQNIKQEHLTLPSGFTLRPVQGNPQALKRSELQIIMKQRHDANLNEMVYANADDWAEKVAGEIDLINSATQAKSKPDSKSTLKSKSKKPKSNNKGVEVTKPKTVKKVEQVEEEKTVKEVKQVEEAKTVEEVKTVKEVKQVEEAKTVEEVKTVKEVKQVEEATTIKEVKQVEEAKTVEEVKTVKEVKQVEEATTVKEVKQVEETKTVTIKSKKSIISSNVNYCIGKHCGGELYEGTTSSRIFSVQRSFIKARSSQVDNIAELIDIGSNSRFIVTIDHLIDGPGLLPMLMAEPVMSVTSFFKVESDSFLNENRLDDGSRQRWWTRISESFRCIFGDIVHGMIYLHSLGHICGDVTNHLYVSAKDEGKILPLMDKRRSKYYDIKNLIKKMKEIITLPFPETEVQEAYKLPDELTHLLAFVTTDKLREIPFYWLVNHPYFWSSQERIKFVKDLTALIKQNVINERKINHLLKSYSSFTSQVSNDIDWRKMIDDNICDGFFKHIYDRPKSLEDVKEYESNHPCEIVRYGTNCYHHSNDYYYRKLRSTQVSYNEIEIEGHLRSFFPMIYVDLYIVLYQFTSANPSKRTPIHKAFENWSSSYFAPTTHDASIYQGKQIFGLVQAEPVIEPVSSSLSPSLRALSRCGKKLGKKQIHIPVKKEVMNQSQNLYFGQDEIIQLLNKDKLDVAHISTYSRLLYEDCVEDGLTKTFGFLCPSRVSSSIVSRDAEVIRMDRLQRSKYISNAFHDDASDGKLYLAPYNIMDHWVLCLINPFACTVYYLDPLRDQGREIGQDIFNVVDTALRLYWNQQEKSLTWKQIQCPQQNNMFDCGYYVLRFMREVVDHQSIHIPDTYFADCAVQTYDEGQINEIRDELACHVLRFYAEPECANE